MAFETYKPSPEPKERTAESVDGAAKLREKFNLINYGSSVPLSQWEAENVKEDVKKRGEKPPTMKEVIQDFKALKWGDALKKLLYLIFGKRYGVEGLGFLIENMDKIPSKEKAGILNQIEAAKSEEKELHPTDMVKRSMISGEMKFSLWKNGYLSEGLGRPEKAIKVNKGDSLEDLIGKEKWNEIRNEQVIGVLSHEKLPAGGFLYLDEDGYPLYILPEEKNLADCPATALFRLDEKHKERMEGITPIERKLEWLNESLKPGDILLVNQGKRAKKWYRPLFRFIGRMLTSRKPKDERFPHLHAMVYIGDGKVRHLTMRAGKTQEERLNDIIGPGKDYNAISVARPPANITDKLIDKVKGIDMPYHYGKLAEIATGKETEALRRKRRGKTGTCVDLVSDAAELLIKDGHTDAILEKLADAQLPRDLAESLGLVFSIDLSEHEG